MTSNGKHLHIDSEFAGRCRQQVDEEAARRTRELELSTARQYSELLLKEELLRASSDAKKSDPASDPRDAKAQPFNKLTYEDFADLMQDRDDLPFGHLLLPKNSSLFGYEMAEDEELSGQELPDLEIDEDTEELVEDRLRMLLREDILMMTAQQQQSSAAGGLLRPQEGAKKYAYANPGEKALDAFRSVVRLPSDSCCSLVLKDLSTVRVLKDGTLHFGRNMESLALPKHGSKVDWTFLLEVRADLLLVAGHLQAQALNTIVLVKSSLPFSIVNTTSIECNKNYGSRLLSSLADRSWVSGGRVREVLCDTRQKALGDRPDRHIRGQPAGEDETRNEGLRRPVQR